MNQSDANQSQSSEKFPDLLTVRMAIHNAKIHQYKINQELMKLSTIELLERDMLIRERRKELYKIFHPEKFPNKPMSGNN